jgi:hypothetical protein
MNHTLRVTRNHPYIEEGGANYFREIRCLIREPLEAPCAGVGSTGVCFSGKVCKIIMLTMVVCLDPVGSLSLCQHLIDFLASPKHKQNKIK